MRKTISVLLVLSLILSLFCACSAKKNEETEEEEQQLEFTYDAAYSSYDQSAVNAYEKLCQCVIDYTPELRMNTGMLDSVLQLFYTSFPLSALVKDLSVNDDNSGVNIEYKYPEEEHKSKTQQFIDTVNETYKKCSEGTTNKNVYVVKLYNYIASSVKISENKTEIDETVSCLDTVLNGVGSSFSYSQYFEYMLRMNGIPAYHVLASDAAGAGWGLTGAELNNQLYYFDILSEYYNNGGEKLIFFGMTSADVRDEGLSELKFTSQSGAPDASDLRFDICRKCDKWELDGAKLLVTVKSGEIVEVAL